MEYLFINTLQGVLIMHIPFRLINTTFTWATSQSLLSMAAEKGSLQAVHFFLYLGDDDRDTALLLAAYKGHTEITQALLSAGADIEAKDNGGRTALYWAAYKEDLR